MNEKTNYLIYNTTFIFEIITPSFPTSLSSLKHSHVPTPPYSLFSSVAHFSSIVATCTQNYFIEQRFQVNDYSLHKTLLFIKVSVCVCTCVLTHMEARDQCQVSSSTTVIFKTESQTLHFLFTLKDT